MERMFGKNWKSTLAFFLFLAVYVYTIYRPSTDSVVNTAGYIALVMSVIMILRNEFTTEIISKLVDAVSKKC